MRLFARQRVRGALRVVGGAVKVANLHIYQTTQLHNYITTGEKCMVFRNVFAVLAIVGTATGQSSHPGLPPFKQTYQVNLSTAIMPCNKSGLADLKSIAGWGVVDFDWSNHRPPSRQTRNT